MATTWLRQATAAAGEIYLSRGGGWPAFIRSQLACGAYTVVGRQTVDGVGALETTGNSGQLRLWVNPATYLPVRLDQGQFLRTDFQWLPATPANLALLNMPVPASFHQVAPPPPAAAPGALSTPHVK